MHSNQSSFNTKKIAHGFNKKANISKIYQKIEKKFSLKEKTIFASAGYYKFRKNTLLICLTNQKIFIDDEKGTIPLIGVYTYKQITNISYFQNHNAPKKSYLLLETDNLNVFKIKGISQNDFNNILKVYNDQKDFYFKSYIEKIGTGQNRFTKLDTDDNFSVSYISGATENTTLLKEINDNSATNNDEMEIDLIIQNELSSKSIDTIDNKIDKQQDISLNELLNQSNLIIKNNDSKIKKKVISDEFVSENNTFSSAFIVKLLTDTNTPLPNGEKTLLNVISKNISFLEQNNMAINGVDNVPINIDKKIFKLNTLPVLIESKNVKNLHNSNPSNDENHLVFMRNWIEYTKHDVTNKILGVDEHGNGVYLDSIIKTSTSFIDIFKAKEYKINDQIRYGLRSSQTISFYERNQKPGLDYFYKNIKNNQKLNVNYYDGILFMGIKYYFGVYNEFSKLQTKFLRIYVEDKFPESNNIRKYELIFDDDLVTYKAYNERNQIIDDSSKNANSFDLKWLMFFKD